MLRRDKMEHYLDNAATTRVSPAAAQAAMAAMTQRYGNPSSRHALGAQAGRALAQDRETVAKALGCAPEEILFTSCGTEGDNWAVRGAAELGRRRGRHVVTTAIEHAAVLEPCKALERAGYEVTYLKPDRQGNIAPEQVAQAVREDTVLVSMMLVNNEVGSLLPVAQAARCVREAGCSALVHCDAVQGFLKVPFTVKELGVDLLTVSGHKIHAPKGVGALYIRRGVKLPPLVLGGGQESGLRSGTESTALIAAFAAAVAEGTAHFDQDAARLRRLREETARQVLREVPGAELIGGGGAPHILALTLPGYKSEVVVRFLSDRGVYLSSGSACHKGKPSHVFAQLGLSKKQLDGALRVSFSAGNTPEDVDALILGLQAAQRELFPSLS